MKRIFSQPIFMLLLTMIMVTSCMTTKTPVGQYKEQTGKETTYSKSKQFYLFWGVVPIGRTSTATPASGDCMVITRSNIGDILISTLTGGIICSQTIKVKVKQNESKDE